LSADCSELSQLHQQPFYAVLRPTFIQKLCHKLQSVATYTFIQTFDQNFVFFSSQFKAAPPRICLIQRQNSRLLSVSGLKDEELIKKVDSICLLLTNSLNNEKTVIDHDLKIRSNLGLLHISELSGSLM